MEAEKKYRVYALTDPRDNQVRYIGQSSKPLARFTQHLQLQMNVKDKKNDWLRELLRADLVPTISLLDEAQTAQEARRLEAHWILHHLTQGCDLLNGEVLWARTCQYTFDGYMGRLKIRASKTLQDQLAEQTSYLQQHER